MAPVMNSHCSCCHPPMIECEWGSSRLRLGGTEAKSNPQTPHATPGRRAIILGRTSGAQLSVLGLRRHLSLLWGPQSHNLIQGSEQGEHASN